MLALCQCLCGCMFLGCTNVVCLQFLALFVGGDYQQQDTTPIFHISALLHPFLNPLQSLPKPLAAIALTPSNTSKSMALCGPAAPAIEINYEILCFCVAAIASFLILLLYDVKIRHPGFVLFN